MVSQPWPQHQQEEFVGKKASEPQFRLSVKEHEIEYENHSQEVNENANDSQLTAVNRLFSVETDQKLGAGALC